MKSTCLMSSCNSQEPYHPSGEDVRLTSTKQVTRKDKQLKTRLCPPSIFATYPFVSYCKSSGCISCFYCRIAHDKGLTTSCHSGELAFCSNTFCDWKKCYEKIKKHSKCNFHKESLERATALLNSKDSIAHQLDRHIKSEQEMNRKCLLKVISSLKYLARQGEAIRGHTDVKSNLIQLLNLRAEDVPELVTWLDNKSYMGHEGFNEILEINGNTVVRSIVNDIGAAGYFSLIADESRDISNKEQLCCVLRWVEKIIWLSMKIL